jgi:hypothetical protein
MNTNFNLKKYENGQVIPIVVIGIIVIIMMAALLLDGGMLLSHHRTAQAAADSGAMAGAAHLCPNNYDEGLAKSTAIEYVGYNNADLLIDPPTVSGNSILVETIAESDSFFARIFGRSKLQATAEAEATCSPLGLVSGAVPFVYPCDPVIDVEDETSTYGNCKVVYGDPDKDIQWHVDNDKMTIFLTSDEVNVECEDKEDDSNDGNVQCGDNVVAMGNRGWISLTEDGGRNDIPKWIAGDHSATLGIGYWVSSFTGVDTNLYLNHISKIVDQIRIIPIYNKHCGQALPSVKCRDLYDFDNDNESLIRDPEAPGQANYRINAFAYFKITCVYPTTGPAKGCPYRDRLIEKNIIPDNNKVKSVEGYFIPGKSPVGFGGGPDFKLYVVQLTK